MRQKLQIRLHAHSFPFGWRCYTGQLFWSGFGEMIAASDGLAYRIAIMRRHMGMDVILPYVLWVALLLYLIDLALRELNRRMHPWFQS